MALKKELKEFLLRGNVIDMAVGIIVEIGRASCRERV